MKNLLYILLFVPLALFGQETIMSFGDWELQSFVDEFGDISDDKFLTTNYLLDGTFSNSATTNSELTARLMIIDSSNVSISLYEYDYSKVKSFSKKRYTVKMKLDDGSIITDDGFIYEGGDRIYIGERGVAETKLHRALKTNQEVKILIKEENSLSSYRIDISNTSGYSHAYDSLIEKVLYDNDEELWELHNFVDEFGDSTQNKYMTTHYSIDGVFSNPTTTNSELSARLMIVDSSNISISLYEYDYSRVKSFSKKRYTVKMKLDDGSIITDDGIIYSGGDRVYIGERGVAETKIHRILKTNNKISVMLISEADASVYRFNINNTRGYVEAYKELHPEYNLSDSDWVLSNNEISTQSLKQKLKKGDRVFITYKEKSTGKSFSSKVIITKISHSSIDFFDEDRLKIVEVYLSYLNRVDFERYYLRY